MGGVPLRGVVSGRVHIIGAGMAGLAAAVRLADAGVRVTLHEAAGHAGGRCRSFHDRQLDRVIDNGNHLVLSGNHGIARFLHLVGGAGMETAERAEFAFVDLVDDTRWTLRPDRGAIPWSALSSRRRVPGTSLGDYLGAWRLARAGRGDRLGDCLTTEGTMWRRFWHPLAVSILNTEPAEASAELMWAVMKETFGRGEAACRPMIARHGLSVALVDPALRFLAGAGAELRLNERVRALHQEGARIARIGAGEDVQLAASDRTVLALPPSGAAGLIPGLAVPDAFSAIVNGHFIAEGLDGPESFLGVVGGTAEWLFRRGDVISVTVSAANALADRPDHEIAALLWGDVSRALRVSPALPGKWRIIKEKRATFAQTPVQAARRPGAATRFENLFLAGDWTDTGLPATIEGAVRSGFRAAADILKSWK
jgi:squalene-associated FAD-dependent desaturase